MISFGNDYTTSVHPKILQQLITKETQFIPPL